MNMWEKIFSGFTIACFLIWIISTIVGAVEIHKIDQNYREIRQDVSTVNQHDKMQTENEYTQTIDFLENEMTKYREFAENQQEFLIWLVGILGVGLTALFGFFEIKGRSDISKIIQEQYKDRVRDEFESFIGGQKKVQYLESSIEKEENAKNKKILFVFQNDASDTLKRVYKMMQIQSYCVEKRKADNYSITDQQIEQWTKDYSIIIYQVAPSENKTKKSDSQTSISSSDVTYAKIAKICDKNETYGILYCENGIYTNPELLKDYFYTGPANFGLTLLERIYNLLYFIGNDDQNTQ